MRHIRGLWPSQGPQCRSRYSVGVELKFHGVGQVREKYMKRSGRIMKKRLRNSSALFQGELLFWGKAERWGTE